MFLAIKDIQFVSKRLTFLLTERKVCIEKYRTEVFFVQRARFVQKD